MSTDFFLAAMSQVAAPNTNKHVASPWRRTVAYIVDSFLLGLVGTGIGSVFSQQLSRLDPWGIFIGFFVGALYFAPLDSRPGNGQSVGKRLLNVRVVDAHGEPIPFGRALIRYTIFSVPSVAYDLKLPIAESPWIVSALIFAIVLWVGGSTLYLIIFEGLNRQGLHDLASGSYVVHFDHEGSVEARPVPQGHWMILGALLLTLTVCSAAMKDWSEKQPTQVEFHRDQRLLENMDGVRRAHLKETLEHSAGGGAKTVLYVNVTNVTKPASEEAFASSVAKTLMNSDQSLQSYGLINVRLFYGYDIWIARRSEHREFGRSPAAWRSN